MDMSVCSGAQPLFQEDAGRGIFRFSPRVYSDPELFEREQRRIFDRAWALRRTRERGATDRRLLDATSRGTTADHRAQL